MKNFLILFLFFIFIFTCVFCSAGSVSLSTYYPAPFGNYDTLRLVPRATAPTCTANATGSLYVNSIDNNFYYCQGSASPSWVSIDDGIWQRDDTNHIVFIEPNAAVMDVAIGKNSARGMFDVERPAGAAGDGSSIYLQAQTGSVNGGNIFLVPGNAPLIDDHGVIFIGDTVDTHKALKLTILNDGGIYASGSFGSGRHVPNAPAGGHSVMIWYPRKGSFRAGAVTGTQWDNGNIGDYSVALGYNTTASGANSIAIGNSLVVSESESVGIGRAFSYSAGALESVAIGLNTGASLITGTTPNTLYILGGNGVAIGSGGVNPYKAWSTGNYAKLTVDGDGYFSGGIKVGDYQSDTCNEDTVGVIEYYENAMTPDGTLRICAKKSGVYAWREIALP